MLNKILKKVERLIADYEKTKNEKTLNLLTYFCGNMSGYLVELLPAFQIYTIPTTELSKLYELQNELIVLESAENKQESYNKCKDIYNLVMEFKNEDW